MRLARSSSRRSLVARQRLPNREDSPRHGSSLLARLSTRSSLTRSRGDQKSGGFERDALCRVDVRELLPPVAQIKKHVAGSYAPVTILIDERPEGVHLSYDRMASFLAPYENSEALKVAKDLDAKVEALLAVAGS
jgi:hypothetical protein